MGSRNQIVNAEDRHLSKKIVQGDEKAFRHFFDYYFPRLFRFTFSRLDGDEELTKDIVQETMMRAITHMKTYRGEATLLSWLCQISRNLIYAHFKKENKQQVIHIGDHSEIQEIMDNIKDEILQKPEKVYSNDTLRELIFSTLDHLPHGYGDLLELKYLDHLSVEEIASQLDTSAASIQSKLARAREAFKRIMTRLLGDHAEITEESTA
ncbi:RNA polymerase sigma factor [Marinicella sp. W31]|uniref:RNA polymerase sigma factor n=1 Tax=Marinicella sp. W31 TaxID=3023713 RepID=UPI0037580EED